MLNWHSDQVQVNGHSIHYYRTGGQKPPLILLHGFSDNGLCWLRAAQTLHKTYDLIMPDAHGHGLSYRVSPGQPLNLVDDVAGLIQALALKKPALLGHSMGASTAASVAARYPEMVGVLLLEDPPWFDAAPQPEIADDAKEAAPHGQWLLALWDKPEPEIIATGQRDNPAWPEVEFGPWAASKVQLDRNILTAPLPLQPWTEVTPKITCPTLLLTAEPELGAMVSRRTARQIAENWPRVQVVHIRDAGHNIRREHFDAFIETVTDFLQANYRS